jgi:hypothetical protein
MMFIVILLLCLCSSSSAGAGGYFYTTGKKEDEVVEATGVNFELKYQEAVRALEAEKQANLRVEVAKTDLEKAQERLAIAKLEFEGFEFEDEESRQRARTKVFEAEKAAEEAISRLDEAETYAEKAAVERDMAEKNADSALEVAITNANAAVTKAEGEASARLIAANARLEEAKLDAAAVIEAAQAYADDVLLRGEADRKKIIDDANARLAAATTDAEAAEIRREIDRADREWAKEKEEILADLDTQIETANEDLSEAQAAVSTANTELAAAQSARQEAEAGTEAALLATAEADAARNAAAAAETDGACSRNCSGWADVTCLIKPPPFQFVTKTLCDAQGSDYRWKTSAEIEEERLAEEAAEAERAKIPNPPTMTTGTGGPHNGGPVWQSHDIGGRFHSPPGLVWLGGNQSGDQPWNQSYKFRCEKDGYTSSFSPTYGPVNFRRYHKPKIQVSEQGATPCQSGAKLEVWDTNTNTDITSQMKNFSGTAAYNGTDNSFWDSRDIGINTGGGGGGGGGGPGGTAIQ